MRLLYEIGFFIFSLFYLPIFFLKGKWGRGALSRLGRIDPEIQTRLRSKPVLWVHAVSVGEIGLAVGFINRLRDEFPSGQFLITTTTVAGHEVAAKIKNEEDILLYFPADFGFAVRSFIRKVSPSAVVFFETELWPNLLWELKKRSIPSLVLNGRISDRAINGYLRARPFFKDVLRGLSAIGVQDERMRERFISVGASVSQVTITGNMKFDWTPSSSRPESFDRLKQFCRRHGEFLLVAGSTHDGEEETLFEMFTRLQGRCPQFRLLIAPRHLQRLPDIEKQAQIKGVNVRRVSTDMPQRSSAAGEVWLLDQMGVLAWLYEIADAAFVGGSLVPRGGHNLVEPAFYQKPVLFGPSMANFSQMAREFTKNGAARQVRDAHDLEVQIEELIRHPERCQELGRAAKSLVLHHQGATDKSKELLMEHWQPSNERKLVSA